MGQNTERKTSAIEKQIEYSNTTRMRRKTKRIRFPAEVLLSTREKKRNKGRNDTKN